MIYLIAGRSGAGKDYLVSKIIELSKEITGKAFTTVKSYTTRPPRYENEDTHIFIAKEDVNKYPDKVAITKIGEYEYFATAEQVNSSEIYVIDPKGIDELIKNMPDTEFQIVYVQADEDINRRINAVKRADDKIREEEIFSARDAAENEQFTEFEDKIHNRMDYEKCFPDNVNSVIIVTNTYKAEDMEQYARMLVTRKIQIDRMRTVVRECIELGIISESENTDANGNKKIIAYCTNGEKTYQKEYSIDTCVIRLLGDEEGFADIIGKYIALSPRFDNM